MKTTASWPERRGRLSSRRGSTVEAGGLCDLFDAIDRDRCASDAVLVEDVPILVANGEALPGRVNGRGVYAAPAVDVGGIYVLTQIVSDQVRTRPE